MAAHKGAFMSLFTRQSGGQRVLPSHDSGDTQQQFSLAHPRSIKAFLTLYLTASDGKLGGGLRTRLAFRVIRADEALLVLATVDQLCVDVIDG